MHTRLYEDSPFLFMRGSVFELSDAKICFLLGVVCSEPWAESEKENICYSKIGKNVNFLRNCWRTRFLVVSLWFLIRLSYCNCSISHRCCDLTQNSFKVKLQFNIHHLVYLKYVIKHYHKWNNQKCDCCTKRTAGICQTLIQHFKTWLRYTAYTQCLKLRF